jgi:hypothetical protein
VGVVRRLDSRVAVVETRQERNLVDVAELQRGAGDRAQHIALIEQSVAEVKRRDDECRAAQGKSWEKVWAELRVLTDDLHSTVQSLKLHVEATDERRKTWLQVYGQTIGAIAIVVVAVIGLWSKSNDNHAEIVASETRIMQKLDSLSQTQHVEGARSETWREAAKKPLAPSAPAK